MGKRTAKAKTNISTVKNVLIIYPHWHPANLAGVHRPRLIGNFLPEFGWNPIILTVKSEYFEEKPDPNFKSTFRDHYEVYRVNAFKIGRIRLIGDIGLRGFFQLYNKAKQIIAEKPIDFIWIPIPSFYTSIIGRLLYNKTKIPYGIDYIDPWVRDITNQKTFRAVISQFIARNLEPYAVSKAEVITGVSTPYYQPVIDRNFKTPPVHAGMPYGFDPLDHEVEIKNMTYPWDNEKNIKPWIYAGAFLPNSHLFVESFFAAVAKLRSQKKWDEKIKLYFLGTGMYPAKRITSYAKDYGLEDIVVEKRERYPFLHILNFLNKADRVMLFGSTERHYTASKTFQCLLSKTPLFSMLHEASSAYDIIKETKADACLFGYKDSYDKDKIVEELPPLIQAFINIEKWNPDLKPLEKYSSKESAKTLVRCIEQVIETKNNRSDIKKVLIISPHFPPVNAADMHRVRQTLPFMKKLKWEPTVLSVLPEYVELSKDKLLEKYIPNDVRVYKVKAFSTSFTRNFGVGNLGIRSFYHLYVAGCKLIKKEKFDLIYFSTTVFACLPLGRLWKSRFKVPFIIDMQDPWRNDYYLSVPENLRPPKFRYAYYLDKYLEKFTIPKVDGLISVTKGYIDTLQSRYPEIEQVPSKVLTLGAHPQDLDISGSLSEKEMEYKLDPSKVNIVYAGVIPKNMLFSIEALFKAFKILLTEDSKYSKVHLHFIGTNYATGNYIRTALDELTAEYNLNDQVTERPLRLPYFQALKLVQQSDLSILMGTTDKDYTASKLYPYVLTQKPMLAIFNEHSSVVSILKKIEYGSVITFNSETNIDNLAENLYDELKVFLNEKTHSKLKANELFNAFLSKNIARQQVVFFDEVTKLK